MLEEHKNKGWINRKYIIFKNCGECKRCQGFGEIGPYQPSLFDNLHGRRCPVCHGIGYDVKEVDNDAVYFVLRLDKDPHARVAMGAYAASVFTENSQLAEDIISRLRVYSVIEKEKVAKVRAEMKVEKRGDK